MDKQMLVPGTGAGGTGDMSDREAALGKTIDVSP
jgi:hypothetical protein